MWWCTSLTFANRSKSSLRAHAIISRESFDSSTRVSMACCVGWSDSTRSNERPELHGSYTFQNKRKIMRKDVERKKKQLIWDTKRTLFFNLLTRTCTIFCWGVADAPSVWNEWWCWVAIGEAINAWCDSVARWTRMELAFGVLVLEGPTEADGRRGMICHCLGVVATGWMWYWPSSSNQPNDPYTTLKVERVFLMKCVFYEVSGCPCFLLFVF